MLTDNFSFSTALINYVDESQIKIKKKKKKFYAIFETQDVRARQTTICSSMQLRS